MHFNLIIIGDEILHGCRQDKHFPFFKQLLEQHGFKLNQVQYLLDDRTHLTQQLQRSFSDGLPTFITGGIGGTPDDHTRQAAAAALNLPLKQHPQAAANIEAVSQKRGDDFHSLAHQQRLQMAHFPAGAACIPNSYNNIAGFSIHEHYFLPGFPVMAHPMAEWVLHTYYQHAFHATASEQRAIWVYHLPESAITPLMLHLEAKYPSLRTFSLPSEGGVDEQGRHVQPHIEFGLKAEGEACQHLAAAWEEALQALRHLGGELA